MPRLPATDGSGVTAACIQQVGPVSGGPAETHGYESYRGRESECRRVDRVDRSRGGRPDVIPAGGQDFHRHEAVIVLGIGIAPTTYPSRTITPIDSVTLLQSSIC